MKKLITLVTLFSAFTLNARTITNTQKIATLESGILRHFAFGSCNDQKRKQPLWDYINTDSPDLWVWGGDNIYADTSDPAELQRMYDKQNAVASYQELKQSTPIIGIWDDHDYGHDNATYTNTMKYQSQQLFLDFLEVESKSIKRLRDGAYSSYDFGEGNKKAKFIMLDNRFFHSAPKADLLGSEQWSWLEDQLKYSDAKIHFIMAGLSIISPRIPKTEEWADHPVAQKRLFNLLKKYKTKGVVFLSGDKHFSSIWKKHGFLEFMSSGMTHTVPTRVLRAYIARRYPLTFFGLTYGDVKIHWNKKPLQIQFEIRTTSEKPVFTRKFELINNEWEAVK